MGKIIKAIKFLAKYCISRENRQLFHIAKIPRYSLYKTNILGFPFELIDGPSFIGQYNEIIKGNIYKF